MCVGKDEAGDSETRTRREMGDTERKHRGIEDWDTAQQCFREASQERESTRRKADCTNESEIQKQRDTAPIIQSQSRRAHADRAPSQQTDMQQSTKRSEKQSQRVHEREGRIESMAGWDLGREVSSYSHPSKHLACQFRAWRHAGRTGRMRASRAVRRVGSAKVRVACRRVSRCKPGE